MNGDYFLKWVTEQLLPNLSPNSVVVMDNASYHSMKLQNHPNTAWKREDIVQWLNDNEIAFKSFYMHPSGKQRKVTKKILLEITDQHKPAEET
jgi:hypothetical protein